MTANRRIFLNIVATYGRSLYALGLGLFTARWALQALGQVDYGLFGVVGGLTGFISFFNGLIGSAVGRFYGVAIGKASVPGQKQLGIDECRGWFSTAVFLHMFVPIVLMAVGYPVGVWAVERFLTIPADRVEDCIWVFRFFCISCFVGMVTIPINAMYNAKQYIAELTIYSFVTTTLNAVFLYYMIEHPGAWLARYAFWTCALSVLPSIVIALRGCFLFPECRIRWRDFVSVPRIKKLSYFVGSWMIGCGGGLLRNQGIQVLVNKYFGPGINASMTIANSVNGHTQTLAGAMLGAFQPAIVNAFGAGNFDLMRTLALRSCKYSMLLTMIFMLPLSLELEKVLEIWLVNPPQYVFGLCLVMFTMTLADQSAVGHMLAVTANGKVATYQAFLGGSLLMSLPLAWLFCALGFNIYFVAVALLVTMAVCAWGRVLFARFLVGMSARLWLRTVIVPTSIVGLVTLSLGWLPHLILAPSFFRIIVTSCVCEGVFFSVVWFVALDGDERRYVKGRLILCCSKFRELV